MVPVVFLLIFNLATGNAQVFPMPSSAVCELKREQVIKEMHLSAKNGAAYNAVCMQSKVFVAKRQQF